MPCVCVCVALARLKKQLVAMVVGKYNGDLKMYAAKQTSEGPKHMLIQ